MKKIIVAVILAAVVLAGYRIFVGQKSKKGEQQDASVPVEVAQVSRRTLWETVLLTGDIRGYYEAQVFPKVPGKLKSRVKDVGEEVKSDETFAVVDRDEPALEYAPAEVKAPFSGIITRYFSSEGETVSPAKPLAEVASIEKIKLVGQVSEKDLNKISVGQKVNFYVDTYPGVKFSGEVVRLSQVLDALSRTATVEVIAENPSKKLKPGMFGRAEILVRAHSYAMVIPRQAVIYNADGENMVFVMENNNVARERKIRLGLELSDVVEVVSGLKDGETVVTLGQYNLKDGALAEVVKSGASSSVTK